MPRFERLVRDPGLRYLVTALAWGLGIFGLLRFGWVERHLLLPFTGLQERVACAVLGDPAAPISVGLSCSGADVIALCLGAILAFPASWGRRLIGAGGGMALILALNTVRIGTLGRAAAQPALFRTLHLYVWPSLLVLAVAAYVFLWMRSWASGPRADDRPLVLWRRSSKRPLMRFGLAAGTLIVVFVAVSPWLHQTLLLQGIAERVAATAATLAGVFGVAAESSGGVFRTRFGSFLVTPECVTTPLMPVYLAALVALPLGARRRITALIAAPVLFFLLATARLLVLALPSALVGSHLIAVHGFHQLLLGGLVVAIAAWWRCGSVDRRWAWSTTLALALGAAAGFMLGPGWTRILEGALRWAASGSPPPDPQGALLILPAYQIGLFAALWMATGARGRRPPIALALLLASQAALLWLAAGLWGQYEILLHARELRAWGVAAPLALAWLAMGAGGRSGRRAVNANAAADR